MQFNLKYQIVISIAFLLLGCSNSKIDELPTPPGDPVETNPPNSDYQPAFPGQTRIGSIKTETPIQTKVIASDLSRPWGITHLPNGNLLITEKEGSMKIYDTNGKMLSKVTGFPSVVSKSQGGLLDVVLDPDFEQNRMIFWTFSEAYEGGNLTSVAKGRLSDNEKNIENSTVIFRSIPAYNGSLHYGGRLVFDKNGYLYLSTGERSDLATRPQAQHLNSALGKILKMTKDGDAAPGNPFLNDQEALDQIFSLGHRNVQGLAIHPQTQEIWSSEMGPKGGDELNLIEAGKNYGWPIITYGLEYSGKKVGEGITQKDGLEQPRYYWDPSKSPSGITFYDGEISEWENNLFIACLGGQHIIRLVIEGHKVVGEERLLESEGERFRDVHQGKDGKLYAITDSGKLYQISKK